MATFNALAEECRLLIAMAGGGRDWTDTRESWLARAARRLGISPGRANSLFYRKARNISAVEYLTMKERADAIRADQERHQAALQASHDYAAAVRLKRSHKCGGKAKEKSGKTD